jgi:hypothetical protein
MISKDQPNLDGARPSHDGPGRALSPADWAAREADARQAIHDSLRQLRRDLRDAVDPRVWVRKHPWFAVTAAAAAGYALSDNKSRSDRPGTNIHADSPQSASSVPSPAPTGGLRSAISREIMAVIRPVLIAAVAQHLKSTLFPAQPPADPNASDPTSSAA